MAIEHNPFEDPKFVAKVYADPKKFIDDSMKSLIKLHPTMASIMDWMLSDRYYRQVMRAMIDRAAIEEIHGSSVGNL